MMRKVKVCGHWYKIRWVGEDFLVNSSAQGTCSSCNLVITIVDDDRKKETLLHEITHAIYYEYSLSEVTGEEAIVGLIASGWHQVLVDNPKLIEYIV